MSKGWYPVIDYEMCSECGVCIEKCTHGVYKTDSSVPLVVEPDECVHGCRGCQTLCPQSAISYIGDTGETTSCSCNCVCQIM